MAVIYRNVTGPVKDSQGDLLATGTFQANLHAPLVDGTTFVSPELVEEPIVDGQFSTPLAAPGIYDFTVVGPTEKTYWQFTAFLGDDSGADISLAELYAQSTTIEMPDSTELFTTLLSLLDTPTSYVGKANYPLLVNVAEDAVVFGDVPVIDSHSSLTDLDADDHLQYVHVDGTHPLTASWNAGQQIGVPSILFDVAAGVTDETTRGLMYWNSTDQTLNLNVDGGPVLQIGQEFYLFALNNSGALIPDGTVVYLSGAQGDRLTVGVSDATNATHSRSTIGIATQDIPNNQQGFVTVHGLVRGLNTLGISEGSPVFLSDTVAGGFEGPPPPEAPNSAVFVGMVVREHNTEGSVFVTVADAGRVVEHSDVHVDTLLDNQLLAWNTANSRFENVDPPIGIPDPSGETDGDVLTIDTGAAVWAPAAGGGYRTFLDPHTDAGVQSATGTFQFVDMANKTQAELITDGWEFDITSAADCYVEQGTGLVIPGGTNGEFGMRFTVAQGTANTDFVACFSTLPDRNITPADTIRFGVMPTSGSSGHVCEWRCDDETQWRIEGWSSIGAWPGPGGSSMGILNSFHYSGSEVYLRVLRAGDTHYVCSPISSLCLQPGYVGNIDYANHTASGNQWRIGIWVSKGGVVCRWIRRIL
jgi:hypothetical protein